MKRTVCELFAGVGGFRCGLNAIKTIQDTEKTEKWETVWFSQWEPGKKNQWAHDCYVNHFGQSLDLNGADTTNIDIAAVDKQTIPDHNLLVGGFPCQDYSVARSLSGEKGIEGKKGVLWWSIREVIRAKNPSFVLLENVDRLVKSPSTQRGRDFGIILACLRAEGYVVEWRIINAAEYGYVQRRRRTFIFAYKRDSAFGKNLLKAIDYNPDAEARECLDAAKHVFEKDGFFAQSFPIEPIGENAKIRSTVMCENIVDVSDNFHFLFENSGFMVDGKVFTYKTTPKKYEPTFLGEILEDKEAAKKYFVPENKLYYTDPEQKYSDETEHDLPKASRQTWQYLKGGKKRLRTSQNGHEYVFSEGPISMIDEWDAPARTMLTSEGSFNRSTHIVRDKVSKRIRILTPIEAERIQGFPDDWTKECLVNGEIKPMTERMRYFCMGNALVVNLIAQMEPVLSKIIKNE